MAYIVDMGVVGGPEPTFSTSAASGSPSCRPSCRATSGPGGSLTFSTISRDQLFVRLYVNRCIHCRFRRVVRLVACVPLDARVMNSSLALTDWDRPMVGRTRIAVWRGVRSRREPKFSYIDELLVVHVVTRLS